MDENPPPDNGQDNSLKEQKSEESTEPFKASDSGLGRSEESSSSNNTEEVASGSTDNQGDKLSPRIRFSSILKNRTYRNSRRNEEDSEEPMQEEAPSVEENIEDEEEDDDDNEWEDYDEDDDDLDEDEVENIVEDPSGAEIHIKDHPLFKKEKPKHNWFAIKEIDKRQIGYSSKLQSRELFQRRCYGSLYCVQRLELLYNLEEHRGCVNCLNFHPDGSLLASGSDDLKVIVWDWKSGKKLLSYKTKHRSNVFQSKFLHLSGDLHVVSCARDGQVRLAQLNREEGLKNSRLLGCHRGPCHKLIVLPEQPQIVLSAGEDGAVLRHDVRGPKSIKVVNLREDDKTVALYSIHGHPLKSQEFCVCGRDPFVRVYDQRQSSKPLASYSPFKKTRLKSHRNHQVTCSVYNYNGSEILASYSDADIYIFDVNDTEHFIHQYQGHRNGATIKGVNFFGPKSEFIVSGSDCGHIYFWEKNTEALVQFLAGDDSGIVNCLEPHPQLPFICTSGLDWDVKVWVPKCDKKLEMEGLNNALKSNLTKTLNFGDPSELDETQILFMLWRHLRTTSTRMRPLDQQLYSDTNSSGSDSLSAADGSDDDLDRPPNCNTS